MTINRKHTFALAALLGVVTLGCQRAAPPTQPEKKGNGGAAAAAGLSRAKHLLGEEPKGAQHVFALRKQAADAKDGEEIAVVGRIGGSTKPFTGRASFTIVDASLKPCNELEGDTCTSPWDYCCEPPENLARATLLVKIVDERGKTLAEDAASTLGLKPLQTVVVRGIVQKDDKGSITSVHANGVFVAK